MRSPGADVLVNVTDSPILEAGPAKEFFTASTSNLVEAARRAGVGHFVVLSIITFERLAHDALARKGDDTKKVVVDPEARYYGRCWKRAA